MSFGGFKFGAGASTSAPGSANPAAPPQLTVPSFSLTGATPTATPSTQTQSQPFSFGAGATQPAVSGSNPTGGLFGGAPAAGQAGPGGGLFGSGGGGLFGAKPGQPSGTGTTSGLFGGASTSTSTLFGAQQPQTSAQQPGTTSLFGQSTAQPPAPAPGGTGLFAQSTAPQSDGGLFRGSTSGTAGLSQSQAGGGLQGGSTAGPSGLSKTTKFAELPEAQQKVVEQLDAWIKLQKQAGANMNLEVVGRAIWQTSGDIKAASEEYAAIAQGITSLQASLQQLRDRFLGEEEDLRKVAEIWETFKSVDGRPGAVRVAAHRDFPQDFFSRMALGMEERVARYKKTIAQLHRAIASLAADREAASGQAIAQTIQNHQNALITLAAQLEDLQLRMNDLRTAFAQEYRERTSSMRDPFEIAREEKGLLPVRA